MAASHGEVDPARTASAASSEPVVVATEAPGSVLGWYRIERELGVGAVGVVYAAFDADLERRIALEVLRRAAASDQARERLLREARAMARLAHPNVVTVHDAGTAAERDFIAMEQIVRSDLRLVRFDADDLRAITDDLIMAGRAQGGGRQ